jgi:hypothetical protein
MRLFYYKNTWMRITIIWLAVVMVIMTCSCSKSKTAVSVVSTWQIRDTSYSASTITTGAPEKYISVSDGFNGLAIYFPTIPPVAGNYRIVNYSQSATLGANEIAIGASTGFVYAYLSTGFDSVTAQVTLSGSKVNVVLPAFWALHYNLATALADSAQVSGELREY